MNEEKRIRLLLADNSAEYRRSVRNFLELDDYIVEEAGTPQQALEKLGKQRFDLVLVDLRLEDDRNTHDMSGLEIAKFASERGIPSILITAFPSVELARAALRSRGAESYAKDMITKGSDPQVVLDSISSTLRYVGSTARKPNGKGLVLDLVRRLVLKNGTPIKLSPDQYALLEELHKKDGGVCSDAELVLAIYGDKIEGKVKARDTRLRNLVDRTKKKIDDTGNHFIEAVSGRGYRLNLPQ